MDLARELARSDPNNPALLRVGYDRTLLKPRIAHIGVGGFHRAHLAVYCDELAELGSDWGIRGIGLLAADKAMAAALGSQSHLFTVTEKDNDARHTRLVGSMIDYVLADRDPEPAIAALASPDTDIVSLTITEAGYAPTSANERTFAILAAALERRAGTSSGAVTILSCDNVSDNGDVARGAILRAARQRSAALATWVDQTCAFPNSMVDRITPTTVDADRDHIDRTFGVRDAWPVVCEPFRQWVLEDSFAKGRPDWTAVGVQVGDDVGAWELYKLRMLNAGHTAIAYLASLAGYTHVDQTLADPTLRWFLHQFLTTEAAIAVEPIDGFPASAYANDVIRRFSNTGVRDQIARLCADGAAKFSGFVVPTVESLLEDGHCAVLSALAFAGWAHYLIRQGEHDSDPGSATLGALAERATRQPGLFVTENPLLPGAVRTSEPFRSAFEHGYRTIATAGVAAAIGSMRD